jgi:hypothetical protein
VITAKLLVIILILPYVSYIYLSESPYSAFSNAEHIVGDLTLRFYPDESIGVKLKAEGIQLDIEELDILKLRIRAEAEREHYKYVFNASLLISKVYEAIMNYSFSSNWIFEGSRDEIGFSSNISMFRAEGLNLTSVSKGRYIKVSRFLEVESNITISLSYMSMGINQTTVEGFIRTIPTIVRLLKMLIDASSEGALSLGLQLEYYTTEHDRCILYLSSKLSGSLIGLRKLLESDIELPIVCDNPGWMQVRRSAAWDTALRLFFETIDKASELRYAWITSGWIHCKTENGLVNVSGILDFSGDIDRYATEIMWATSYLIRDLQEYSILLKILKYPTKISIKNLDIDLNLWNNTLNVYISGVKLADIDPYNMLRIVSDLSRKIPMDKFTLSLEGSSNSTSMVELSMPDLFENISKPMKIEGKHRIIWMFRNLDSIDRVVLRKVKNTIGVSDLTFYESRCKLDGKLYILKIYTNSTLLSDPILRSDSLTLTLKGTGRCTEAFNISIPNSLIGGIIACASDGEVYMKPRISRSLDECWVYLSYLPNFGSIDIIWGEPEFRIESDKNDVSIGDEVKITGVLRIHKVGLRGENITLIVDGEPISEIQVTGNGTFSYSFKAVKNGALDIWARYSSQDLIYETEKIRVSVSEYRFPYIAIVTAAVAAASLTTILVLYKRRSPYLPFLKRF